MNVHEFTVKSRKSYPNIKDHIGPEPPSIIFGTAHREQAYWQKNYKVPVTFARSLLCCRHWQAWRTRRSNTRKIFHATEDFCQQHWVECQVTDGSLKAWLTSWSTFWSNLEVVANQRLLEILTRKRTSEVIIPNASFPSWGNWGPDPHWESQIHVPFYYAEYFLLIQIRSKNSQNHKNHLIRIITAQSPSTWTSERVVVPKVLEIEKKYGQRIESP